MATSLDNMIPDCFYFNSGSYWIYQDQFGNYDTIVYLNAGFSVDTIYSHTLQSNYVVENFRIQWDRSADNRTNIFNYSSYLSVDVTDKHRRTQDKLILSSGTGGAITEGVYLRYPMSDNSVEPINTDSTKEYIGFKGRLTALRIGSSTYAEVYEYETYNYKIMDKPRRFWVSRKTGIIKFQEDSSVYELVEYDLK